MFVFKPGMMAHVYNPAAEKMESGARALGLLNSQFGLVDEN